MGRTVAEAVTLLVLSACTVSLQQPTLFFRNTYKGLNGVAAVPGTAPAGTGEIRAVYSHEQTVAVVNLSTNNELQSCDLIEVYEPSEANQVLRNLSTEVRPQQVSFRDMTKLMRQCDLLDKLQQDGATTKVIPHRDTRQGINPLTLFAGILPGTKWCGTGDIADNYHDLGRETQIDRCCRNHDLCPVKVRAQQIRYNLTNYSVYSKSHCSCDGELYDCLKAAYDPMANIIGHIYFNIIKVPCIEDIPKSQQQQQQQHHHHPRGPTKRFVPVKASY